MRYSECHKDVLIARTISTTRMMGLFLRVRIHSMCLWLQVVLLITAYQRAISHHRILWYKTPMKNQVNRVDSHPINMVPKTTSRTWVGKGCNSNNNRIWAFLADRSTDHHQQHSKRRTRKAMRSSIRIWDNLYSRTSSFQMGLRKPCSQNQLAQAIRKRLTWAMRNTSTVF